MTLKQGFHISACSETADYNTEPVFETLEQAAMALIDVVIYDDDKNRVAAEIFYVDEEDSIYVRWHGRWALELDDGTVDTRAPLPDILRK